MSENDKDQPSRTSRRALQDTLLDALHAMRSMEEIKTLETASDQEPKDPEGLIDRLANLTGSAIRFGVRATDTSVRVGRALINSQDQLRAMLTAGQSLKDIREVAGLTLSEMSEALDLRDKSVLEAIENGTSTLSFELILRLAALIARNDPIPFIMRTTRNYNPEVWQILNDWGVGRLPLQFEREREFINIFRRHDDARNLSDEGFQKVLEFTRQSFEMSLHFVEEQEKQVADFKASYAENHAGKPSKLPAEAPESGKKPPATRGSKPSAK
ncbi:MULTISPECIES: helix-turn-helix domain-containing protein [Marinobacter]|jgi:transcriptional regulator with XRE-family HTH domain|uniref:helix-turn-helix domain-containing protein n=2 Tax=Marinobacteraceae TaxID=2887365 RepID=UPI0011085005|nr:MULTISPECIES: helix-turn-helix transcriptional regulator [Marinobacter]MCK2149903.1 helix-turn-helix domain-containing protein [Marinobacter alexandrii]